MKNRLIIRYISLFMVLCLIVPTLPVGVFESKAATQSSLSGTLEDSMKAYWNNWDTYSGYKYYPQETVINLQDVNGFLHIKDGAYAIGSGSFVPYEGQLVLTGKQVNAILFQGSNLPKVVFRDAILGQITATSSATGSLNIEFQGICVNTTIFINTNKNSKLSVTEITINGVPGSRLDMTGGYLFNVESPSNVTNHLINLKDLNIRYNYTSSGLSLGYSWFSVNLEGVKVESANAYYTRMANGISAGRTTIKDSYLLDIDLTGGIYKIENSVIGDSTNLSRIPALQLVADYSVYGIHNSEIYVNSLRATMSTSYILELKNSYMVFQTLYNDYGRRVPQLHVIGSTIHNLGSDPFSSQAAATGMVVENSSIVSPLEKPFTDMNLVARDPYDFNARVVYLNKFKVPNIAEKQRVLVRVDDDESVVLVTDSSGYLDLYLSEGRHTLTVSDAEGNTFGRTFDASSPSNPVPNNDMGELENVATPTLVTFAPHSNRYIQYSFDRENWKNIKTDENCQFELIFPQGVTTIYLRVGEDYYIGVIGNDGTVGDIGVARPIINTQSLKNTISASGSNNILFVNAEPFAPINTLTYQWYKDGILLVGETNPTLRLNNITSANEGVYTCLITETNGLNTTSEPITLSIVVDSSEIVANLQAQITSLEGQVSQLSNDKLTLQNTITSLNSQIDSSNNTIIDLTNQITTLQGQLGNLDDENEELLNQIADLTSQIGVLNGQISSLNNQVNTLTDEKDSLLTQISNMNTTITNLTSQVNYLTSQLANSEEENAALRDNIVSLNTQISNLTNQINTLTIEVEELELENASLSNRVNELTVNNNALMEQVASLQTQLNSANQTITELENQISNLSGEINTLQSELTQSNTEKDTLLNRVTELETEVSVAEEKITELQGKIVDLENKKNEDSANIEELNNQINDLNNQINGLHSQTSILEQTITNLTNEKTLLEENVSNLNNRISELESEVVSLREQVNNSNTENTQLRNRIDELELQVTDFINNKSQIENQLALLTQNNINLTEQVNNLVNQNSNLQSQIDLLQGYLDDANNQIGDLNQQVSNLTNRVNELEQTLENSNNDKSLLEQTISNQLTTIGNLNNQIIELERQIDLLTNNENGNSQLINELNNQINTLTNTITDLQSQLNNVVNEKVTLEIRVVGLTNEISRLEEDITTLTERISQLEGDNTSLLEQVNTLNGRVSSLEEQITELDSDIATLTDEKNLLQDELSKSKDRILVLDSIIAAILDELGISDENEIIPTIRNLKDRLNQEVLKNQELITTITTITNDLENAINQNKSLEEKLNELKELVGADDTDDITNRIISLQSQLENSKNRIDELEKEKNILTQQLADTISKNAKLEEKISQLQDIIDSDGDELAQRIEELNNELDQIKLENDSLSASIENLNNRSNELANENSQLKTEIIRLESLLDNANKTIDELRVLVANLTAENESLKDEKQSLKTENESLKAESEPLKVENESLKAEIIILKELIANDDSDKNKALIKELQDEINTLKEKLKSLPTTPSSPIEVIEPKLPENSVIVTPLEEKESVTEIINENNIVAEEKITAKDGWEITDELDNTWVKEIELSKVLPSNATDYTFYAREEVKPEQVYTVKVEVEGKTFTPTYSIDKTIYLGHSYKIQLTNTDNATTSFISSDSTIATVSNDGTITSVNVGKATIVGVVKSNNKEYSFTVNVTIKKDGETLNLKDNIVQSSSDLPVLVMYKLVEQGSKTKIDVKSNINGSTVKYISSDSNIVTVDSKGYVYGKKKGDATVTTIISYNNEVYTYVTRVRVSDGTTDRNKWMYLEK